MSSGTRAARENELDLVWGVREIGRVIGCSTRKALHLCTKGELPVKKVGGRWVAERAALRRFFQDAAA